jgi:ubiquinone/menaquinone biosynthesis C-methylase UbiE
MTAQTLWIIATWITAFLAIVVITGQCRKPRWWLGRLFLRIMNKRHSTVTDWGLRQLPLEKNYTVLDIGCGGGRTIQKLATMVGEGKVWGIDYSAASVAAASNTNAREIAEGRVAIQLGSVSHLPFPDEMFDAVTAVETHYYWSNLIEGLREIRRVLKPGGRLIIIAETYKGRTLDALYWPVMKLLRANYLTVNDHRQVFQAAGYADLVVSAEEKKGWICAAGSRPVRSDCGQAL